MDRMDLMDKVLLLLLDSLALNYAFSQRGSAEPNNSPESGARKGDATLGKSQRIILLCGSRAPAQSNTNLGS